MEGVELRVFEVSLLWALGSAIGCGLWATGLLSLLYLNYLDYWGLSKEQVARSAIVREKRE